MRSLRVRGVRMVGLLALLLVVSCGDSPAGGNRLSSWFDVLDGEVATRPPRDDVMQLDLSKSCRLMAGLSIAGRPLTLVGAGTAGYGEGQGVRYQCAWTGDRDDRPANARLEVIRFTNGDELRRYEA